MDIIRALAALVAIGVSEPFYRDSLQDKAVGLITSI
jgi:hypothetical protein